MLLKTKDMQRFIREKIDFDKKKLFKKYLRCKAANILQNKNQAKTITKRTNFFQIYPNKQTVFKANSNFYNNALQPLFHLAFV